MHMFILVWFVLYIACSYIMFYDHDSWSWRKILWEKILPVDRRLTWADEPMASGLNLLRPRGHGNIRHGSFFSDDVMEEEEVVVALEEENQIRKRGDSTAPTTTTTAMAGSGSKNVGVDRGWLQLGISDDGRRRDYKGDPRSSSSHSSAKPELDLLGGNGSARRSPLAGFPAFPCVGGRQRRWQHQRPSSSSKPSPSTSARGRSPPATANMASCGEIRVVRLARRTQTTAVWLVLQAAQEQYTLPSFFLQ